jgi:hypothetical protein
MLYKAAMDLYNSNPRILSSRTAYVKWLVIPLHIQEVPGSYLGLQAD